MSVGAAAALLCGMGAFLLSGVAAAQAPAPTNPPADPAAPPAGEAPAAPAEPAPAEPTEPPPADAVPAEPPPVDLPPAGEAAPAPVEELPLAEEPVAEDIEEADGAEVVVTVDRRRKNLQDYSGTASAFTEAQLSAVGITNVRDLSVAVPGLQIGTQETGTTIYIRGIGSDNNTELGDPAVALHIDGVYIPRPRGLGGVFYDIERVEVNSGPQGTLRGRNATGGSVNIITKQPNLEEVQANAEATFGSYSLRRYTGMVNLPLVPNHLGLRVAALSEVHDPYWENAGPIHDLRGAQDNDSYSYRVTAKYSPSKVFELTVGYDFLREAGTGYIGANWAGALQTVTDNNDTPQIQYDDTFAPFDVTGIDNPRRVYQRGRQAQTKLDHQGVRATATVDAGPVLFELLGSYRDLHYVQFNGSNGGGVFEGRDISGENPDVWGGTNQWDTTSKSYIGELRAYAPDTSRLRWTVGAFGFYEDQGAFLGQMNDPIGGFGGGEFNMPSTIGWSMAGYADATFDVVDNFRVLGGIRVTREHKDRKNGLWALWNNLPGSGSIPGIRQPPPPANPNASLGRFATEGFEYKGFERQDFFLPENPTVEDRVNLFFDGIRSFGARDEVPIALCNDPPAAAMGQPQDPRIALNEDGNWRCTNGVRAGLPNNIFTYVPQNNEVDNTFFDYRAGVEFDASADSLLYATFSTGHKAAGFNDTQSFATIPVFNSEYDLETLYALELGSKNLFMDRKLRLNGSAFYYGYTGMQFQTIIAVEPDPDPTDFVGPQGSAVRQNTKNRTDIFGADIDVIYALPAGLEAEVHVLLMDARFPDETYVSDSRLAFGSNPAFVDIEGNWLPRASPYTINYMLSQLIFTDVGQFNWQIQAQTRGTHYFTVFNGNGKRLVEPAEECGFPLTNPQCFTATVYDAMGMPSPNPALLNAQNNLKRFHDVQPTFTVFNLGAGWRHPDGRLSISGYVNNAFNINYANTIISTGQNIFFYNNQRLAGVRVRVDW